MAPENNRRLNFPVQGTFDAKLLSVGGWAAGDCGLDFSAQAQVFQRHVVVSQEPNASRIGRDVLRNGGNAVDAAIATAFALAVTHPAAGNIGGGGFLVAYLADRGEVVTFDFRERRRPGRPQTMYLDDTGRLRPSPSGRGPRGGCARHSPGAWSGPPEAGEAALGGTGRPGGNGSRERGLHSPHPGEGAQRPALPQRREGRRGRGPGPELRPAGRLPRARWRHFASPTGPYGRRATG